MPKKAKKQQPRNRGQIVPRGEDKWLLRVYTGRNAAGKRMYASKTVQGTFAAAQKELTALLSSVDTNTYVPPTRQSLGAFLKTWLSGSLGIEDSTLMGYEYRVEKYITPALGHLRLDRVSPQDISKFYGSLEERGLSPRSILHIHRILHEAYEQAVEWDTVARNPAAKVTPPKVEQYEAQVLTPEQVHLFLEGAAEHKYYLLWHVLFNTGLRPQEAAVLKWEDLQDGNVLTIRRALKKRKNKKTGKLEWYIGPPKSKKGKRAIPLTEETAELLASHKVQQAKQMLAAGAGYVRNDYIFADTRGEYLKIRTMHWSFSVLMKQTAAKYPGMPVIRLYDTRHTHFTNLLIAGVHLKVVQERAGHSTIALTADTYSHVSAAMQQDAVVEYQKMMASRKASSG